MNLKLIKKINAASRGVSGTKPLQIPLRALWDGVPGRFGSLPISDDRQQVLKLDPMEHGFAENTRQPLHSLDIPDPAFKIYPNRYSASLFTLFSRDRKEFYLLDGSSALGYPRMRGEAQTILGRVLEIRPSEDVRNAMEITFDLLNRGKPLFEITSPENRTNEFFSPFHPPSGALKPNAFWESRIADPSMVERTDMGEHPKVDLMLRLLPDISSELGDRRVNVFDPSCGTGFPLMSVYLSGAFEEIKMYASDISWPITSYARNSILQVMFPPKSPTIAELDVRVGDGLQYSFMELDRKPGLLGRLGFPRMTFWPENGTVDILMLRFLNQGVVPDRQIALDGFLRLADRVRQGGYIFYFGYSALFLDSFDFEELGYDIKIRSSSTEKYHIVSEVAPNRWRVSMDTSDRWIFPFYLLKKA